jgi:hypothetical protein
MRHAIPGTIMLSSVFGFLCLLVAAYVGITLAGGTDLIPPWNW